MADMSISPSGGKTVSFTDDPTAPPPPPAPSSASAAASASTPLALADSADTADADPADADPQADKPTRPQNKRRRSSLKQGTPMPYRPEKHCYAHPDPLLRRLRLRNGYGKEVDLEHEFVDAKVVLFLFG